jgi:DNA-binding LacI/PurR family transcriptional regulator
VIGNGNGGDATPSGLRAGLADVARAAGVSKMTVSRVLNERPDVSVETRQRVLAIMEELDFQPNRYARALKGGRSGVIGLICPATNFYGPTQVLFGVEEAARDANYAVIVATSSSLDSHSLQSAISRLEHSSVEAIIIISPLVTSADALRSLVSSVPTLAIWAPSDAGLAVTGMNHRTAAAAATQHLLDLGHKSVHHISGPLDWTGAEQRMLGWRTTLEAAGIVPPPVHEGDWTAAAGHRAGLDLLQDPDVSAVFTANDQMALGLYRAAFELGRRIPDDVSVVGYDDGPDSPHYTPPLTTVHQDFQMLGARAFNRLNRIMSGEAEPAAEPDETPRLIIRASTAAFSR